MSKCPYCFNKIEKELEHCLNCGFSFVNTSGQKSASILPANVKAWNWGAFIFTWLWGIYNKSPYTYFFMVPDILSLLFIFSCLICIIFSISHIDNSFIVSIILSILSVSIYIGMFSFIFLILRFICGLKGNEWAWKNKNWENIKVFHETQYKWAKWGWATIIIFCSILIACVFWFWSSVINNVNNYTQGYNNQVANESSPEEESNYNSSNINTYKQYDDQDYSQDQDNYIPKREENITQRPKNTKPGITINRVVKDNQYDNYQEKKVNYTYSESDNNESVNENESSNYNDSMQISDYLKYVRNSIGSHWAKIFKYGPTRVDVQFKLDSDGNLIDTNISRSSGYKDVDEAAVNAIKNSSPFMPPPSYNGEYITLPFVTN